MTGTTRCPDGQDCDGIEVWKYVDPIDGSAHWAATCLGTGVTTKHASLALALSVMTRAHGGTGETER